MSVFVLVFLQSWLQEVYICLMLFLSLSTLCGLRLSHSARVHSHKAFEHMQIASGVLLKVLAVQLCVPYVALEASADAAGTNPSFPYTDVVDTAKPHPCTTIRVILTNISKQASEPKLTLCFVQDCMLAKRTVLLASQVSRCTLS